jgi:hypothetical protein
MTFRLDKGKVRVVLYVCMYVCCMLYYMYVVCCIICSCMLYYMYVVCMYAVLYVCIYVCLCFDIYF